MSVDDTYNIPYCFYGNFVDSPYYAFEPNAAIKRVWFEYIDRGVEDFKEFAEIMSYICPQLTELEWEQNYSHCIFNPKLVSGSAFLEMISILHLSRLKIKDFQSSFWSELTHQDILSRMPANSVYEFVVRLDSEDDALYGTFCDQLNSKTLIIRHPNDTVVRNGYIMQIM